MAKRNPSEEGPEEPSRAAGACVLVVLGGAVVAVAFAVDEAAGVLLVVGSGAFAVWRTARRVSVSSATPPPREGRPFCRECAGHELVDVTPSQTREGMLIYKTSPPGKPHHTHIHVVAGEVSDR